MHSKAGQTLGFFFLSHFSYLTKTICGFFPLFPFFSMIFACCFPYKNPLAFGEGDNVLNAFLAG